jgi:hypothetical protein
MTATLTPTAAFTLAADCLSTALIHLRRANLPAGDAALSSLERLLTVLKDRAKPVPAPSVARTTAPAKPVAQAPKSTANAVEPAAPVVPKEAKPTYRDLQAKCKALGVPATGTRTELVSRIAAASQPDTGPAVKEAIVHAPLEPEHPKAGTVLIADGKGGFRSPTAADAAALMAILDALTAPKAAA